MYNYRKSQGFLTRADVQNLRREYEDNKSSLSGLAHKYGISRQAVHKIVHKVTYKDVPDLPPTRQAYSVQTAYDGMTVDGEFTVQGEVVGGELEAVVVIELVKGEDSMNLQIKSGIAQTQRPMNKEMQVMMLKTALEMLEGEGDK
jgi:hypothetical protein